MKDKALKMIDDLIKIINDIPWSCYSTKRRKDTNDDINTLHFIKSCVEDYDEDDLK